ncbi:hypothetical protein O988_05553 [Pseudogymnoascus sp. VKM F-3808]|nr:hypothetical protein O988_05553 [Pseudogymnoascus sp. VKM F-3808]
MTTEVDRKNSSADPLTPDFEADAAAEKHQTLNITTIPGSNDEEFTANSQYGVLAAEAMTTVWSKRDLIIAFVLLWLIQAVNYMQSTATAAFTPFVTSAFAAHSLTATTSVVSSVIAGVTSLGVAKVMDIWGRPQAFTVMLVLMEIGLIMMAKCENVQTYAAAQVFYTVGYNGLSFTSTVFIADMSQLKNRAFAIAYLSSPSVITPWIGGYLSQSMLDHVGFRWGYGIWAFVSLVPTIPLLFIYTYNYRKAKSSGVAPRRESGPATFQSLYYYAVEFDLIGIILFAGGVALFLLPFNLYSFQTLGWRSPMIICMLVFGLVTLVVFAIWERWFAPKQYMPFSTLTDRTVLGACCLSGILFVAFYIWYSFFYSFLLVVDNLDVTKATYVVNVNSCLGSFAALLVGAYVRWNGRFKKSVLFVGVPGLVLSIALMIAFRNPGHVGLIIMCIVFYALASSIVTIGDEMAVLAACTHAHIATVIAMLSVFASIGGAIGSSIATAIWTGVFPVRLAMYLPAENQADVLTIYADISTQLSFPVGSAAREAINHAYADSQRYMLIAGACIQALGIVAVFFWRDLNVKDFKQVKGTVF